MTEVRITHLHPLELRERRTAVPVAWLPLGTLEWHGRHLPLGVDGINAEALCLHGARTLGGVSFPPAYYGDHRGIVVEALAAPGGWDIPLSFDHRVECCEELGVSVAGVAANAMREHRRRAGVAAVETIERAYWMIRAYGFTRVVSLAGHGGNVIPARLAAELFHQRQSSCRVVTGHQGMLGDGGEDHAGAWETSQMLHCAPELVRRERLADDRPDEPTGVNGDPHEANAKRGQETYDAFVAGCRDALGEVPAAEPLTLPDEEVAEDGWVDILRPIFAAETEAEVVTGLEAMFVASDGD